MAILSEATQGSLFHAGSGLPFGPLVRSPATLGELAPMPDVVAIALFASLLCLCIVVGHLLEEYRWINESVTAILFGLLTGMAVLIYSRGESSHILEFNEELFFIYLLPPIIFNAGFQVKKKQFFRNFLAIVAFGVVGVFISFGIIAAGCKLLFEAVGLQPLDFKDYLALGVIFSATDSVNTLQVLNQDEQPLLYSLVFGEGVVNDATSVVLFRAIQKFDFSDVSLLSLFSVLGDFLYLFFASTALGVAIGLLSAYIIRTLYIGWHSTDREIALMVLMAYLSYVFSELAELSGILTVFFCGIVMSHYTWHNVTESSRVTTKHAFASMSFIAETFIFIYVGMDTMKAEKWERTYPREGMLLFTMLLLLTLLGRAAFVFPLSAAINLQRKTGRSITSRQQVVVWWAGLMRGAVSIALTFNAFTHSGESADRKDSTIVSTTVALVLFTTVVFGLLTRPLIDWLLPPSAELTRDDSLLSEPGTPKGRDSMEEPLLGNGREGMPSEPTGSDASSRLPHIRAAVAKSKSKLGALLKARERDIHDLWRYFDDSYMRPLFGGRGFVPYTPASPTVDSAPVRAGEDSPDDGELGRLAPLDGSGGSRSRLSLRFDTATSVDEGLAESDPAWPEGNYHWNERRRRSESSSREAQGERADRQASEREDWP